MELTSNVHTIGGRAESTHIPPMPLWVAILRIVQTVLAIVVLGLAAYAFNIYSPYETAYSNSYAASYVGAYSLTGCRFTFFAFSWTLLYLVYIGVALAFLNALYNVWAHLVLEVLTSIWWLVSFALLANDASGLDSIEKIEVNGYGETAGDLLPSKYKRALDCEKAAAGVGGLEWLLFVITLVMFSIALYEHRKAHGAATPTNGAAVTEEHKMYPVNTVQPVPMQDPRYPQQYPHQQVA